MTVVRGDAARRLMARQRAAPEHAPPPTPGRTWSATTTSRYGHGASQAAADFITAQLTTHGMADRVPDATAVIRELVDNARQHGGGTVHTTISLTAERRILLEVADQGAMTPALRAATGLGNVDHPARMSRGAPDRPGTGLKLVALLSREWGIHEGDEGKTVWVQLHDHDVHCRGCHRL